jgi:hypothetical protein
MVWIADWAVALHDDRGNAVRTCHIEALAEPDQAITGEGEELLIR